MKKTQLCQLLEIEHPVIQAPMNWITWAELAAAVSNAGGLGVIGPNPGTTEETKDVNETGERLRREIRKAKFLTQKPFAVNLVTSFQDQPEGAEAYCERCLDVILKEGVPAVVVTGDDPGKYLKPLKNAGTKILYRAMPVTAAIAKEAERVGVDAVIAVGFEGGGHTGSDRIPTFVLVSAVANTVDIPVIAGGGIVDGKGMAAALALGAQGVFMGTRFMATTECQAHENVKQAILNATDTSTITVSGPFGVMRALKTPVTEHCARLEASGSTPREISNVYRPRYRKGMLEGDGVDGVFVCGAGAALIKDVKRAADVVEDTVTEAERVLGGL
jgi:enoyl-[acyl-carrier protein] reductase II